MPTPELPTGPIDRSDARPSPLLRPITPPTARQAKLRRLRPVVGVIAFFAVIPLILLAVNLYDALRVEPGEQGSCVTLGGSLESSEFIPATCGEEAFHFVVVTHLATGGYCPEGRYVSVDTVDDAGQVIESWCLMPVLEADGCYSELVEVLGYQRQPCDSAAAEFVIQSVLEIEDASQCERPDLARTFAQPSRTYCLLPL